MSIFSKLVNTIKNKIIEFSAIFSVVVTFLLIISIEIFNYTYSRISEGPTSPSNSRVEGNTAYVDDLLADYNYLKGLNFTEIRNQYIPSGVSTGYYDNDYLVRVNIIYDGTDINNSSLVGALSPINNENVNKFVYYKYFALERNSNGSLATNSNGDNYIRIELIDNPFTKRPYVNQVEYGFNGWVCNQAVDTTTGLCEKTTMDFDNDDYTRHMIIPISDESEITVHLNASWYVADVVTSSDDISDFNSMSMQSIAYTTTENVVKLASPYWKQDYTQMVFSREYERGDDENGYMPAGTWYKTNQNGTTYTYNGYSRRCARNTVCYCYTANTSGIVGGTKYTGGTYTFVANFNRTGSNTETTINSYNATYMELREDPDGSYSMTEAVTHYHTRLSSNSSAQGFYYQVSNPTNTMINTGEYYNANGVKCSSASSCTTAYKLIQFNDSLNKTNGNSISLIETIESDDVDANKYYYLVTRDTNIFRYTSTTRLNVSNIEVNRPFTVTGTAINGTTTLGVLSLNGYDFTASNDIVIENIKIYGPGTEGTENITAGSDSKTRNVIYANSHNLKIGRNVTSSRGNDYLVAESILSGTNSSLSGTFRVIVESGKYYSYHNGTMNGSSNYTFNQTIILGNDYDRIVTENKSKLKFLIGLDGYTGGRYTAGNDSLFASYTVFKSGLFGYNDDGTPNNDTTAGMYIGGYNGLIVNSLTGVKIEGGDITYVTGGYGYNGDEDTNSTYIGMSGGTIRSIYGGAGYSTTKGNRIINVTGGTVSYSILGGSDSYSSNSSTDGVVNGDTLIYVGGNAYVGGGTDTVQGVEAGSVFGAGGGNSSSTQKGTVKNSHIIINGGTITTSVYGGGNYGSTGTQSSSASSTIIDIYDGTIGSVYGGSKSAGFSTSRYANSSLIDINISGGTITNVYGGSNEKGTIYGSVDIDVTGGTITNNVYGGGKGADTYVSNDVDVTIGTTGGGNKPVISGSVYGGSAFGTVNGTSQTTSLSSSNTHVIVNSGDIANVYGGGEGDNDNTPYVCGNVTVDINGGEIDNVFGGNDLKGTPNGTVTVNVNGGTVTNAYAGGNQTVVDEPYINLYGGTVTNAFGGGNNAAVTTSHVLVQGGTATNVFGGSNSSGNVTTSNVVINSGTVTNAFGGNNVGGTTGVTNVTVNGGTVTNVYGGGEKTDVTSKTNVNINSNVTSVFGGSDSAGTVLESDVNINSGAVVTDVFGGNNLGGTTTTSNVDIQGGSVTNTYGGGLKATTGTSNVNLIYGSSTNIYGGGSAADVTTTNVNLGSGTATNVFGGSNTSGNITTSNIQNIDVSSNPNAGSTLTVTNVFGGNNLGGNTATANIDLTNGSYTAIYGGGEKAITGTTSVELDGVSVSSVVYGGGDNAAVSTNTSVVITGNTTVGGNVFGGGNAGAVGGNTVVNITSSSVTNNVYGGGNAADVTGTTTVNVNGSTVGQNVYGGGNEGKVLSNTTVNITNASGITGSVYGGGNAADVSGITNVSVNGSTVSQNVYGGGNEGKVLSNTIVNITNTSTITGNVYGGGNAADVTGETTVTINGSTISQNVYGGGNEGKVLSDTSVSLSNNCRITNSVFGGGNQADVEGDTAVVINNCVVTKSVYGGGNAANAKSSTSVKILNNSNVIENVFGGGNNGKVFENSVTTITNSQVGLSAFAGGNGSSATVVGNNKINIEGTSNIGSHVFGGGNAAKTGCDSDITDENDNVILACSSPNTSSSIVNIAGATIGGNVYGGANTSVVYGETFVNIGTNTIAASENLTSGNIDIAGTVFGGGEANASGSEDYDFNFISVTRGININIDASTHSVFDIDGSIFGSGNASSSGGYSNIYVKNYGTFDNPKRNVSIQRTDVITLDNCSIVLSGAQDRTNKYKNELFTLSRIGHLKLKNNSSIFLEKGANLLENYSSLVDINGEEVLASVEINENNGSVNRNVDNRVYMFEGKNLNISDDESLATFGNVNGMSFFGMFKFDRNGNVATGLYSDNYDYGDNVSGSELYYFSSGSYVVGKHKSAHDIYVDGFYSNYANDEGNGIVVDYIEPTPSDAPYYRWVIGESVEVLEVNLTASKYSTLGTNELQLMDYYHPNTEIHVLGVNYDYLSNDINLLPSDDIPRYSIDPNDANINFGLAMKTGTTGWITKGGTQYTTSSSDIIGNTYYKAENSNAIPSFMFYLYHSKNISVTKTLGTVIISLMVVTPIDDLSNKIQRINVEVNMNTAFYEGDNYEASISPGAKYEMFANSNVNITNKSSFSTYFSLYSTSSTSIYRDDYYRSLVSDYAYPVNTKITMIDFASSQHPEYYYYIIDETTYSNSVNELINQGEVSYKLSNFIKMGSSSPNNIYNDVAANNRYYDSALDKAEEEFVFIVDFKDTNIEGDILNKKLLLELRNMDDSPVIPVLDVSQQKMFYNLYDNREALLNSTANLSKNTLYIGQSVDLNVTTTFLQQSIGNVTVLDTNYYEKRLGIKLSLYNSNNELVNGASLLGVAFVYNGVKYYPRQDGTVRFNIAESVANVSSRITIDAKTSNLVTGDYKLVIETFGSSDGIYYGVGDTTRIELDLAVVNEVFGLDASMGDEDVIIDKSTGYSQDKNNQINFQLQYLSSLKNPSIRISLYRRTYTDIYNYTFELVDFRDYFANDFPQTVDDKVYLARELPNHRFQLVLYAKNNLKTGTYQIRFSLYDDNNYVGHINKYIIITS